MSSSPAQLQLMHRFHIGFAMFSKPCERSFFLEVNDQMRETAMAGSLK